MEERDDGLDGSLRRREEVAELDGFASKVELEENERFPAGREEGFAESCLGHPGERVMRERTWDSEEGMETNAVARSDSRAGITAGYL